jgi:hypothetical protein
MRSETTAVVVAAILAAAGCKPTPQEPAQPASREVTYEIRGASTRATGQSENFRVQAEPNNVSLSNGELTVNSKSFGSVEPGDKILVEGDGRVSINGQPREANDSAPAGQDTVP